MRPLADVWADAVRPAEVAWACWPWPDALPSQFSRSWGPRRGAASADRGYTPVGRLVPCSEPGAVITDVADVTERGCRIASGGAIADADGYLMRVQAETRCGRSDAPDYVRLAAPLRRTGAEVPVNDVGALA